MMTESLTRFLQVPAEREPTVNFQRLHGGQIRELLQAQGSPS